MKKIKRISLIILVIFYLAAGINHFYNPSSYIRIIPHYIPYPKLINSLAGFFELLFAFMLTFSKTRRFAAWGIILMLIAFLPVHIQMVKDAPIFLGVLKVTPLLAWVRLVVLQPLLVIWAWWYARPEVGG
jgi:uncharacterized membrane protein